MCTKTEGIDLIDANLPNVATEYQEENFPIDAKAPTGGMRITGGMISKPQKVPYSYHI